MKIKVKKKKETKEYNLISSWSEVTLEKWLKLVEYKKGSKSKEALNTITALSTMPKEIVKKLAIKDIAVIMGKIAELQDKQDGRLKQIVEVEGKEYGFHPSLDDITLGEYADIETFIKNDIEKHLPELMAVLYRPIIEKKNKVYSIEAYDGNIGIRAETFKKMAAEQVQNALLFFYNFAKELSTILLLYLTEQSKELKKVLQQKVLQKNGVGLA